MAIDADGALTVSGHPVLGEGGPIVLPPYTALSIGADGTISVQVDGQAQMQVIDRLQARAPRMRPTSTKNEAGLIVTRTGEDLARRVTPVAVRGGFLEGSNVSAVEEMVATMGLTRDFEVQMKLYKAADSMAEAGNRLIRE